MLALQRHTATRAGCQGECRLKGLDRHMTRKLTCWARLVVGCTLGLIDCDFSETVKQNLYVILFPGNPQHPTLFPHPHPVCKTFCLHTEPAPNKPIAKNLLVHAFQFFSVVFFYVLLPVSSCLFEALKHFTSILSYRCSNTKTRQSHGVC